MGAITSLSFEVSDGAEWWILGRWRSKQSDKFPHWGLLGTCVFAPQFWGAGDFLYCRELSAM